MSEPSSKMIHAGLPNIGNTCFLNSIIQLLMAATAFRDELIVYCEDKKTKPENNMQAFLLGNIFKILKDGDKSRERENSVEKRRLLEKLVTCVEKFNLSYKRNQQEDAFETLNNLLIRVGKNYTEKYFSMAYSQTCKCNLPKITNEKIYCTNVDQTCVDCQEIVKKQYSKLPTYLIVVNNQSLVLQIKQVNQKNYKLLSKVEYTGNKISGHYVCLRKQQNTENKEYLFNDITVKLVENQQNEEQPCLLILLQAILLYFAFPITYPYFLCIWIEKEYKSGENCFVIFIDAVGMTLVFPITHLYLIYLIVQGKIEKPKPQLGRILLYEMTEKVAK